MGLLSLEVANFKSYKGVLEVPFDTTPFVAVVGPNGSGKSNMLDALCFVIGLDTKELRCKNTLELVTKGVPKDEMYVALKLSDIDDKPVQLKRTVSEFFIDSESVSEEIYMKKWSYLNLLPGGKNALILQGDVERIASADYTALANLVEDISNTISGPFDMEKYHKLEEELNNAVLETQKLTQSGRAALAKVDEHLKIDEAKSKLEDLKLQLRKSEKRKEGLIQREKVAILNGIRKDIRESKKHLEQCIEERHLCEADTKKLRAEFARKRRYLQNARSVESEAKVLVAQSESQLEPVQRNVESLESELRLLGPEVEFSEQSVYAAEAEMAAAKEAVKLLQREFNRDKNRDSETIEQQEDLSPELRQMWIDLDTEFMAETALLQDKVRVARQDYEKLQQQLSIEKHTREDIQSELETQNAKLKNCQQRVQQLASLIEERTSQQETRREELSKVASDLASTVEEQRELKQKIKELQAKIRVADGNKQVLAQRHRLLDAVEQLRRVHPGVHDILGNLIEPVESTFENALTKGIGSFNMDTIIVDTLDTAFACVEQAKKDKLGRLHFMALADVKPRDLASARATISRQVSQGYDVRLLVDCAKFDATYSSVVLQVLGDAAYVSTYEDSRKLRKAGLKMKLVTDQGAVISSNNIVSTSSASSLSAGNSSFRHLALMQRNEINFTEKLKNLQSKEVELTDAEIRLNNKLNRTNLTIKAAEDELEMANEQLTSVEKSIANQKRVLDELDSTIFETETKCNDAQDALNKLLDENTSLRRTKFKKFIEKAGGTIESWDEVLASSAQRLYELRRQGQRLNDKLQLATEKRNTALSQLSKQKERMESLQRILEQVTSKKELFEAELASNVAKLNQARSRLSIARSEAEEKSDEVGMAESSLDNAKQRVLEAERAMKRHKMALATQKNYNPNDVDEDGSDDESDYEDESVEELSDFSDTDMSDDDDSSRRKRKRNTSADVDRKTLSVDRLETKINKLKDEIEVLSRIVGLHENYDEDEENDNISSQKSVQANQVYDELNQLALESRSKQDRLAREFETLRKERTSRFMVAFEQLQKSLSAVYSELLGDEAQIRLTAIDSEKPFEGLDFSAMPPGKPYTLVAQLSGGERSMATLALLFASQKMRPPPFIILDEVDAALDFANVSNLSRYLINHCRETQYIVVSLHQRLFQTATHLVGVYKPKKHTEVITVPV